MAALPITEFGMGSNTLSSTAYETRLIEVHKTGALNLYSTSALIINKDDATADETDNTAVLGWEIPASQGYTVYITSIPSGGIAKVNVWSATTSAVVKYDFEPLVRV